MTTEISTPADQPVLPFWLGRERSVAGAIMHAVPTDDKTNTAVCGARVRVRRSHHLGDTSPLGCPTCAAAAHLAEPSAA